MSSVMDFVVRRLAGFCDVDPADIKPESNAVDDLALDSVDFLDFVHEVEKEWTVKLPVEDWMDAISAGKATTADYFVVARLAEQIDQLRAAAR